MRNNLIRLFDHSLSETTKLCAAIPADAFSKVVNGKSPAWVTGHHAVAADMACELCGVAPRLGDWNPLFAPGSQPNSDPTANPSKCELLEALAERHAATVAAFKAVTDSHLASEFPIPAYREFFPSIGYGVIYLLAAHESYHNGQLQQWKLASGV